MIVYDIHLIMDATEDSTTFPEDLQAELQTLLSEWPSFPAIGTKENLGRKVIHARVQHPALTEEVLLTLFTQFSLNWEVLGIREAYSPYSLVKQVDKATILPYINDIIEVDPVTGVITTTPVDITDTIYLPLYAGTDSIVL